MTTVAVLGAGMAGCGAVSRLEAEGLRPVVFEQRADVGGHAGSIEYPEGFTFDDGPHISFTPNPRIQALMAANVDDDFQTFRAHVDNYWQGYRFKHPVQCNLHGLPADLVVKIIADFIDVRSSDISRPASYEDWLIHTYGRTLAETFPMAYGLKYHTTTAANMTTDWLGPRMYRPTLEQVLRGALIPASEDVHYVGEFRYPSRHGFVSYVRPFLARADVRLNRRVVRIAASTRTLRLSDGTAATYDALVSSVPLPELVPMLEGVPEDVRTAASRLAATTCVVVNLGIGRDDLSRAHWTYVYDADLSFTRLSFPHMFSPHNAPPGRGSIQAEVYYSSKYRPFDDSPATLIEPVVRDLRRCGILRDDDQILLARAELVRHANVIFDLERPAALRTVHAYLDDLGIAYCGRYGEWGYHWTDESFVSGENAASRALDAVGSPAGRKRPTEAR